MRYKLSLHSHTSDFAHLIFTKPDKQAYLMALLKILYSNYDSETRAKVLGVSNFNNNKVYEKLVSAINALPVEYEKDLSFKDYFVSVVHKGKKIYFIKTDEIESDKGHILIIGFKGIVHKRKLNEVLKEAHKQNCLIIANHPLHNLGIGYFVVRKFIWDKGDVSISEAELKKHKKEFNALEENAYFPEDWQRIRAFAKKNKLGLVSDSDSHFLDEVFRAYYEIDKLDFESPYSFKKSLKKAFVKGFHLHARAHGFLAVYRHIFQAFLEEFLLRTGIIKV